MGENAGLLHMRQMLKTPPWALAWIVAPRGLA